MPERPTARDAALWTLGRWQSGAGRPESLLKEAFSMFRLDSRDRALAMELAYGVIRELINLDFILSHFIKESGKGVSPKVRDILRVAAYQVTRLDRVPERAAVFEAVEQAKRAEGRGAGGFANAVLRSLIRGLGDVKYPDMAEDPVRCLSLKRSYPEWLVKRWVGRFGVEEAEALMSAASRVPPLTLRANTLKTDRTALMKLMEGAGIGCAPTAYSPDGIVISGYPPVGELPGYNDGLFAVQDEAAQLVSFLLSPKAGDKVLDACAAPGGKAAHLAAISGGGAGILAVDISLDKIRLLKENISRLGAGGVDMVIADASVPLPMKGGFDGVMLDAPCSALGVIRRRPEIKHTRKEGDIGRLSGLQARMLENLAPQVRPGGALVFATCSTEPEEGELVVEGFLAGHREFGLDDPGPFLPEPARELVKGAGCLRTYPHRHGTDGFFAARLVKGGR